MWKSWLEEDETWQFVEQVTNVPDMCDIQQSKIALRKKEGYNNLAAKTLNDEETK